MAEVMQMPQGFMAVAKSCLDEDYFLDIRLVTAHVMHQFLRIAGNILTGMQPKLLVLAKFQASRIRHKKRVAFLLHHLICS
jgi:hypothetical protein